MAPEASQRGRRSNNNSQNTKKNEDKHESRNDNKTESNTGTKNTNKSRSGNKTQNSKKGTHNHGATPHICKAKRDNVPDHLVGKLYRDFTPAEWWEIRKWRRARNKCDSCGISRYNSFGAKNHHFTQCPLRSRVLKHREDHNLCAECASSDHLWEHCPARERLENELAPFVKYEDGPKKLRGWSYSALSDGDMCMVRAWRRTKDACTECGLYTHLHYSCPQRWKRVEREYNEKVAAVTSGLVVLNLKFDGTLKPLPTEIRLQILAEALDYWGGMTRLVKPGYLDGVKTALRAGLPIGELAESFVSSNIFGVSSVTDQPSTAEERRAHLLSFMRKYSVLHRLRAISTSTPAVDFPEMAPHCVNLKKLRCEVDEYEVTRWAEPLYMGGLYMGTGYSEIEQKVPYLVRQLDLPTL
jgi:hypothetical protein